MRELFPLIERLAADELDSLRHAHAKRDGPMWGESSEDLNATRLAWSGRRAAQHVNEERNVLIFVADSSAAVAVDGDERELAAGEALIVEKGRRRRITAGAHGVRYLSVHLRRPPSRFGRASPAKREADLGGRRDRARALLRSARRVRARCWHRRRRRRPRGGTPP
jgi:hypothetical protein